jgi:hypothetical protein
MCVRLSAKGARSRMLADHAVPRLSGCARSTVYGWERVKSKRRPKPCCCRVPRSAQARLIGVRACVRACVWCWLVCVGGTCDHSAAALATLLWSLRARIIACLGAAERAAHPLSCMGRSGGSRVTGRPQTSALAASARAHARLTRAAAAQGWEPEVRLVSVGFMKLQLSELAAPDGEDAVVPAQPTPGTGHLHSHSASALVRCVPRRAHSCLLRGIPTQRRRRQVCFEGKASWLSRRS